MKFCGFFGLGLGSAPGGSKNNYLGDSVIENSTLGKLLRVYFENMLTLDYHITSLCKKASKRQCNSKSQSMHELIKKSPNKCFLRFTVQLFFTH